METIDIASLYPEEIRDYLAEKGVPAYRAGQIYAWLRRGVKDFDEMTNLPKPLRQTLKEECRLTPIRESEVLISKIDGTRKYLFTLHDSGYVESVLLHYKHGYSVCLSTQVGCKMGCAFCASAKAGFERNLTAAEILYEMHEITRDMRESDPDFRIGHVVLMGIGEPLDNYDNVIRFLKLVNDQEGFGIGYRNLSLSTCGIVPRIYDLAKEEMPITLSISLHAVTDEKRSRLMPVNRRYPMKDLLRAAKDYTEKTGRRISFEYTVIRGENDSLDDANKLAGMMKGHLFHVNLIPVNPTKETGFLPGKEDRIREWIRILEEAGVTATRRRTLGADISAACGQLRREKQTKE